MTTRQEQTFGIFADALSPLVTAEDYTQKFAGIIIDRHTKELAKTYLRMLEQQDKAEGQIDSEREKSKLVLREVIRQCKVVIV